MAPIGEVLKRRIPFTPPLVMGWGPVWRRRGRALRGVVEGAELPGAVAELVVRVTRRTRLWRSEQRDVARELASHFREGLDAGTTEAELIAAFGEERRAARLIRRAKQRGRPAAWKGSVWAGRAVGVAAAVVLLTSAALLGRLVLVRPTPSGAGRAMIDRLTGETEGAAFPIYLEALRELPRAVWSTDGRSREATVLPMGWPDVREGEEGFETAVAYLRRAEEALAAVRRASALPRLGDPLTAESAEAVMAADWAREPARPGGPPDESGFDRGPLVLTLLPMLGFLREAAMTLEFDTRLALSEGDADRAAENLVALFGQAAQVLQGPMLIQQLVGLALAERAVQAAERVLAEHAAALSDEQWTAVAHAAARVGAGGEIRVDLRGERAMVLDAIEHMYADGGKGAMTADGLRLLTVFDGEVMGLYEAEGIAGRTEAAWRALRGGEERRERLMAAVLSRGDEVREAALRTLDASEAEGLLPLAELVRGRTPREPGSASEFVAAQLADAQRVPHATARRATLRVRSLQAAVGIELYRREHGEAPPSLEALAPRYLPSVPVDPWSGVAVRYRVTAEGPVLYSVGPDGDDDGGRPVGEPVYLARNAAGRWVPAVEAPAGAEVVEGRAPEADPWAHWELREVAPADGDWRLWPPVVFGPDPAAETRD